MAERKTARKSSGSAKAKAKVIDVGEPAAKADAAAEDGDADGEARADADGDEREAGEAGGEEGLDADLASAPGHGAIDIEDDAGDHEPPAVDDHDADPDAEAERPRSRRRRGHSEPNEDGEAPVVAERGLARRDPLSIYMSETRRYPLLSVEEEHALAVRLVEHQDSAAARKLVEANLRLVVKIAYEYRRAYRNLLDLVQEGNMGLIRAVAKYDPYRGTKLSTYAANWIRAYMLKFVLNNWRLVKIGTTQAQRRLFFNLRKERERLEQLGFQPTSKLIADNLDVPEREVIDMERRLAAPEASLDAPIGSSDDGDGARTRLDYMPSDGDRPDQAVEQSEFSELLREKLETFASTLEGREQTIFRERWLTEEPLTLQEIGDRYEISRERARQLEKRMLDRLKKYLEVELGGSIDIAAMSRE